MERLAKLVGEEVDEMEVFVNDYETEINGLEISEYENLEGLNEFAQKLESLDEYDVKKIEAIIEADGGTFRDAIDEIDNYIYYSGMTLEDVAYELIEECCELSEFAKQYFDYEALVLVLIEKISYNKRNESRI